MALVLTEEQVMLKDAARDFLRERAPVSHLRELRDNDHQDGFSRELWAEMAEMGWAGIAIFLTQCCHAGDVVAAIHISDFAGNAGR